MTGMIGDNKCMCMYDWATSLYSRNWHSIVNQLYFNTKKKGGKKKDLGKCPPDSPVVSQMARFSFFFFLFVFLEPYVRYMEVPRLGVESEL